MAIQFNVIGASTLINTANTYRDGSGTITTLISASTTYGTIIQEAVIEAINDTTPGAIRFFARNSGGATWRLIREVSVYPNIVSGIIPSFSAVVLFDMLIADQWEIGVSTENSEDFAITITGQEITGFI